MRAMTDEQGSLPSAWPQAKGSVCVLGEKNEQCIRVLSLGEWRAVTAPTLFEVL